MTYKENAQKWLDSPIVDKNTKNEITKILNNDDELRSRFKGMLSFGTAGLRGIMGAGLNRINIYTISYATQGLSDLILKGGSEWMNRGVAIAYDCRNNSPEFAKRAAGVLAANGIKSYIFDELRPTPELSFAIRRLGTIAGINITASHNPKEYNGYKVYWEDGAQLPPHHAKQVSEAIAARDIFEIPTPMEFKEGCKEGLINVIDNEIDEEYINNVLNQRVSPDCLKGQNFKVVYTPFHGAGYRLVPEVLKRAGIGEVITVPEQMEIDGDFPTVRFPNPEEEAGFSLAIKLANKEGVDLIIATDPDSDRLGVMARNKSGGFSRLTGNQIGVLLLDYIIKGLKAQNELPKDAFAVKTIVSTKMADIICEKNGVEVKNVLTGFKFIGEKIKEAEEKGKGSFIFGFEESYGYLKGSYARDKDGVVAALLVCEAACYYNRRGMSLFDAIEQLYNEYGYFNDRVKFQKFEGLLAQEKMTDVMDGLRKTHLKEVGGLKVTGFRDYLQGFKYDVKTGGRTPLNLPSSNVLCFEFDKGMELIIRPSGTEPKIKYYVMAIGDTAKEAKAAADKIEKGASEILKA